MNVIVGGKMYGSLTSEEEIEARMLFRGAKNPLMQIEIICDLYQVDLNTVCKALKLECDPELLKKNLRATHYDENPTVYAKIVLNWGTIRQFALQTGLCEQSVRKALRRRNMADSKIGKRILEELQNQEDTTHAKSAGLQSLR